MASGKTKAFHWAWIILATCFVDLFINYSVRLGYGIVLPEMIRTLGFGRTAGGSIYNFYLFSYIALTPLTGYLTDRFGARRVITTCCLILSIGTLLMGTVKTLWAACLFYAVCGLGATGMWTPVITVVQRWFSTNRRGLALGILSTGYGMGFAVMGAVFPLIVSHSSWRNAWYFLGIGALIMVGVNGILLRSDPEDSGYSAWGQKEFSPVNEIVLTSQHVKKPFSIVLKDNRFWFIGLSYLSISYSLYGITTFMVDYARYQIGLPLESSSFLATIHGVCQLVGVLTILPLSDTIGRKTTIIISNSFITAFLAGILFTGNSSIMLYALVGGIGIFYGVTFPIYGACAGDYFPKEVMGTIIGAWTPFYGVGAILVHWVTGVLRDVTGVYDYAFILNIIMAAVAVLLFFFVKNKK
ncbi:MAG: MFS transporter [Thermodesulfobacteriota bacterium]|nr:MFS transporter [Thermodesulfobacteriota bacterium]